MLPKLLTDENIDYRIVKRLRKRGFEIISINKCCRGYKDNEVLDLARVTNSIIITGDSDFERLPSRKKASPGIICLKNFNRNADFAEKNLLLVLSSGDSALQNKFIAITPDSIIIEALDK